MNNKISVIIPVYNSEKHLSKCLDSVVNQTYKNLEIICINDGSCDNSLSILKDYALKDNRIKIIDYKENKGAGFARNIGIDEAKGDYIGFIDSDDFIDLDFYEKLYNKAIETNSDVAKGKLWLYYEETKEKRLADWIDINDKVKEHKANFCCTFTTGIYKLDFIKKYDVKFLEGLIHFEDPYFTIKVGLFYEKVCVVDEASYYYVDNKSSTSRNITLKHIHSMSNGANQIINLLNKYNVDEHHYKIVFNFVLHQILSWCNKINVSDEIVSIFSETICNLFKQSKFPESCLAFYFIEKNKESRKELFKKIRENLNKNKNK